MAATAGDLLTKDAQIISRAMDLRDAAAKRAGERFPLRLHRRPQAVASAAPDPWTNPVR